MNDRAVPDRLVQPHVAALLLNNAVHLLDLRSQSLLLAWRGTVNVTSLAARIEVAPLDC